MKAAAGRRSRGAELFHRAVEQAHVAVEQVVLPRRQTPSLMHLVAQPHHSVGEQGHLAEFKRKASSLSPSTVLSCGPDISNNNNNNNFSKRLEMQMLVARQLLWKVVVPAAGGGASLELHKKKAKLEVHWGPPGCASS